MATDDEPTCSGTLLFQVGEEVDDTDLILEYERKEIVLKRELDRLAARDGNHDVSTEDQRRPQLLAKDKWHVDDWCRAPFSGDGRHYEARIVEVNDADGTATVRFEGYGAEDVEEVALEELRLSFGSQTRECQRRAAREDRPRTTRPPGPPRGRPQSNSSTASVSRRLDKAPAVDVTRLFPAENLEDARQKAFDAMMLSSYMYGFHAGLYAALSDSECDAKDFRPPVIRHPPPKP